MTGFEERGVRIQRNARSIADANRKFWITCNEHCSSKGRHLDCDQCAIKEANEDMHDVFEALYEIRRGLSYAL